MDCIQFAYLLNFQLNPQTSLTESDNLVLARENIIRFWTPWHQERLTRRHHHLELYTIIGILEMKT